MEGEIGDRTFIVKQSARKKDAAVNVEKGLRRAIFLKVEARGPVI